MRSLNGLQRAGDLVHAYGEKQVEIPQRQPSCKKGGKDVKRKCRKLLSLLTALCLVFSMTPLAALADEGATLQSQINEAAENTETKISLAADTTESITIPKNKIIVFANCNNKLDTPW